MGWIRTRAISEALKREAYKFAAGAASVTGKSTHIVNVQFDIAALTAKLTTVAGAVLAHVEASRLDF